MQIKVGRLFVAYKTGGYAQQSLMAAKKATEMQAQAVQYIRDQYHIPSDDIKLDGMSIHDLVSLVEQAARDGATDQLNAKLAAQIAQMVMQPKPGA